MPDYKKFRQHLRGLVWSIIKCFRTIVLMFIAISATFRSICLPAFFRCLSNSRTYTELRTTSFIKSTGIACSDSVSHKQVQVLSIPVCNGYRHWFPNLLRRQSSGGCRFNPDCRRVTIQKYLLDSNQALEEKAIW